MLAERKWTRWQSALPHLQSLTADRKHVIQVWAMVCYHGLESLSQGNQGGQILIAW